MQGTNPLTMQCTYSTPCGWCTKWDKKCDKKIGVAAKQYDATTNQTCKSEEDHKWYCCGVSTEGSHYRCIKCGEHKFEPYTISTSDYYEGEWL